MEGPIPNLSQLGEAIREERQEKTDLTIEEFALEAGMEYSYLSDIERKGRNFTWRKLAWIAEVLKVDVSQLIFRAEEIARRQQAKPDDDRPKS
ncbi:MAG TPA: helix-turn-helix transcriptional regulator [Solirubrobacterales bacterium]|nr:helix-turn-helix transcriptional regulator [Solirubrobacterales bacterium]